ncbi:MAG: condensation domain-containing protein [Tannerellaceae bacterium]|nr:condensation domain-containing protein [Tannerellaceae bacterium]
MKTKVTSERFFLRSPNINVCFRIQIDREFNPENFAAAMNIVCKCHPLLQCSIEKDEKNEAWFVPNIKPIEVEYFRREEMPDWKVWYNEKDSIPFDFPHENLLRISAIVGDNQTEIIILGHHIIGDGMGYFTLSKDLLLALDNRLEATPQILPPNDTFIKGKQLSFLARLYIGSLNKKWRKDRRFFSENEYRDFFHEYRRSFSPQIYTASIPAEDLQRITTLCRSNGLSVNELITAAFAFAFAADKKLRIGIAINARNELTTDPHSCMGNYVTGVSFKANCRSGDNFIASAKNIIEKLRRQLTNPNKRHAIVNFLRLLDGDLIESIMFASYGNYQLPIPEQIGKMILEGLTNRGLGISNLGRYEMNNYNTFCVSDLEFIGAAFPANIVSVGIITVNNKLNICLRYNEADMDEDAAKNICTEAMKLMLG